MAEGQTYAIEDWCQKHVDAMRPFAELLDQANATQLYVQALALMQQRIDEVDDTLSAQVIADTLTHGGTWNFGSVMAQQHAAVYEQHQLSPETQAYFDELAQTSLQQQQQLEQDSTVSFDEYLAHYR